MPPSFFELFEFEQLLSAFATIEFIALADGIATIDTILLKEGAEKYEAKDLFGASAAGFVQVYGFSSAFVAAPARGGGGEPIVGLEAVTGQVAPVEPGVGKKKRRLLASEYKQKEAQHEESTTNAGNSTKAHHAFDKWFSDNIQGRRGRDLREGVGGTAQQTFLGKHELTSSNREELREAGFWELFGEILPNQYRENFSRLVSRDPSLSGELSEYELEELQAILDEEFPPKTVEPILDVWFVLALGVVGPNSIAATEFRFPALRFAPGFFAIAAEADPFAAVFAEASALEAIDDAAFVTELAAANEELVLWDFLDGAVEVEVAVYVLLREQVSINGADIAAVF